MSKKSKLNQILEEMISTGQKMIEAATALKAMNVDDNQPINETVASTKSNMSTTENKENDQHYSLEDVRSIMAALASKGKKTEVKDLLSQYGAKRLSEVKEEDYVSLVAAVKELDNE